MNISSHLIEYALDAAVTSDHTAGSSLLSNPNVLKWLVGDCSFLDIAAGATSAGAGARPPSKTAERARLKILEDEWGRRVMKARRPDLELKKDWTNLFGEYICRELYTLLGGTVRKPLIMSNLQPDLETDLLVLEAKAGTFFTTGTAHEKIVAVPFKYASVPKLYGKPLRIVCIGGAEKRCRDDYGNLGGIRCCTEKKLLLDFYKTELEIEFVAATDLIRAVALLRVREIANGVVSAAVAVASGTVSTCGLEDAFNGLAVAGAGAEIDSIAREFSRSVSIDD